MKVQTIKDELVPVIIVGVLLGTYATLLLTSQPTPDMLEAVVVSVVSYYFGSKATQVGQHNGATLQLPPESSVSASVTSPADTPHP